MNPANNLTAENYLRFIIYKLRFIFISSVFVSSICFYYYYFESVISYKASITFYITNADELDPNVFITRKYIDNIGVGDADLRRIKSFAHSDVLVNKIIKSNELSDFFYLNSNDKFEQGHLFKNLASSYTIEVNQLLEVVVSAIHPDREKALEIAEMVMLELNNMNNGHISSFKKHKLKYVKQQLKILKNYSKGIRLSSQNVFDYKNDEEYLSCQSKINSYENIINNEQLSIELLNNKKAYVLNKKLPPLEDVFGKALKYSIFSFLYSIFILVILLGVYLRYGHIIKNATIK